MKIVITKHAVDRYIERFGAYEDPRDIKHRLRKLAASASKLKDKTVAGQDQYVAGDVLFVVKVDRSTGELIAVTIGRYENDDPAEDAALSDRISKVRAEILKVRGFLDNDKLDAKEEQQIRVALFRLEQEREHLLGQLIERLD